MRPELRLVRRAERASGVGAGRPSGPLLVHGRLAVRPGAGLDGVPAVAQVARSGGTSTVPATMAEATAAGWAESTERLRADAVVTARLSRSRVRARAFYLPDCAGPGSATGQEAVTLAAHARSLRWRDRGTRRLLAGAAVQAEWSAHGAFVVPQVLDAGSGFGVDWVVEQLLLGKHPDGREWQRTASTVLEGLLPESLSHRVGRQAVRRVLRPALVAAVARMLVAEDVAEILRQPVGTGAGANGRIVDPANLIEPLHRLACLDGELLVGVGHGDPVPGNVLILEDGRLALIDWELAGRRLLAHDVAKVLRGVADPLPLVERTGAVVAPVADARTAPWAAQVAVAVVRQLGSPRSRQDVAHGPARAKQQANRIRAKMSLLAALLQDAW